MSNDDVALAHVITEIEQIISGYLASPGKSGDANSAIEQFLLNIDANDGIGIALLTVRHRTTRATYAHPSSLGGKRAEPLHRAGS
jgi:hypothetical protein